MEQYVNINYNKLHLKYAVFSHYIVIYYKITNMSE